MQSVANTFPQSTSQNANAPTYNKAMVCATSKRENK